MLLRSAAAEADDENETRAERPGSNLGDTHLVLFITSTGGREGSKSLLRPQDHTLLSFLPNANVLAIVAASIFAHRSRPRFLRE